MSFCAVDEAIVPKCSKSWWTATVLSSSVAMSSVTSVWRSSIIITVSEETTSSGFLFPEISGFLSCPDFIGGRSAEMTDKSKNNVGLVNI